MLSITLFQVFNSEMNLAMLPIIMLKRYPGAHWHKLLDILYFSTIVYNYNTVEIIGCLCFDASMLHHNARCL